MEELIEKEKVTLFAYYGLKYLFLLNLNKFFEYCVLNNSKDGKYPTIYFSNSETSIHSFKELIVNCLSSTFTLEKYDVFQRNLTPFLRNQSLKMTYIVC